MSHKVVKITCACRAKRCAVCSKCSRSEWIHFFGSARRPKYGHPVWWNQCQVWKQRYSFPDGGSFWRVIRDVVYCWHCIVSHPNGNWSKIFLLEISAVALCLCFLRFENKYHLSSTVTSVSNTIVVCSCVVYKDLVWMRSSVVCIASLIGLEYVSIVIILYLLHQCFHWT